MAATARRRRAAPPLERGWMRDLVAWCHVSLRLDVAWCHYPGEDTSGGGFASHQARMLDGVMPGWPDLQFFRDGRAWMIECKREGQGLKREQPACHARLRAAGVVVATCWSLEEAQQQLREWGMVVEGS